MQLDPQSTIFLWIDITLIDSFHDDCTHLFKRLFTVLSTKSRRLIVVLDRMGLNELFNGLLAYLSIVFKVVFVADQAQS